MSVITGTLRSASLVSKAFQGAGTSTRDGFEVWLLSYDFAAYTGSTDTATVTGVPAAINARVRDGKTRTLIWGAPAFCGADTANQPVNLGGTSVAALTISTNDFTGQLNTVNTVATEVTATTAVSSVGILVGVAVT